MDIKINLYRYPLEADYGNSRTRFGYRPSAKDSAALASEFALASGFPEFIITAKTLPIYIPKKDF